MHEGASQEDLITIIRRQDEQLRELRSRLDPLRLWSQVEAIRELQASLNDLPASLRDGSCDPAEALALVNHLRGEKYHAVLCFEGDPAAALVRQAISTAQEGEPSTPPPVLTVEAPSADSCPGEQAEDPLAARMQGLPARASRLLAVLQGPAEAGEPLCVDALPRLLEACSGREIALDLVLLRRSSAGCAAADDPQPLLSTWRWLLDGLGLPADEQPLAPEATSTLLRLRLRPDTDCSRAALDAIADLKRLDREVTEALPHAPQHLADLLGATQHQLHRALERLSTASGARLDLENRAARWKDRVSELRRERYELRRRLEQAPPPSPVEPAQAETAIPDPETIKELEDLRAQLEEAREESELLLKQLHQTQEELEHYFLLSRSQEETTAPPSPQQSSAPARSAAPRAQGQKEDAVNANRGRLLTSS